MRRIYRKKDKLETIMHFKPNIQKQVAILRKVYKITETNKVYNMLHLFIRSRGNALRKIITDDC